MIVVVTIVRSICRNLKSCLKPYPKLCYHLWIVTASVVGEELSMLCKHFLKSESVFSALILLEMEEGLSWLKSLVCIIFEVALDEHPQNYQGDTYCVPRNFGQKIWNIKQYLT
jgi:hypothetical protein